MWPGRDAIARKGSAGAYPSTPATVAVGRGLELALRGGHRISVGRGFDAAVPMNLVRVLESGPC